MKSCFILFLGVLFCACSERKSNPRFTEGQIDSLHIENTTVLNIDAESVIDVHLNPFLKEQEYDFAALLQEVNLIPLETPLDKDESLLDAIYKVIATDSNIYIYDKFKGGGLVVFDNEGKFIRRIPNGPGPGELSRLYDIDYDANENKLIAYVHSFLLHYTSDGEFIKRERLPFGFYNFMVTPDGYLFKTLDKQGNGHLQNLENYTLLVTDKNFAIKSAGLPYYESDLNYTGYNYLYRNGNELTVTQRFTDTIYQYFYQTGRLKAKYVLDYSQKAFPKRLLQEDSKMFFDEARQNDYYYYLGEYLETPGHTVFFLKNDYIGQKIIVYRDRKTGHLQGGTFGLCDAINEIPSMSFPIATSGDFFIACHYPNKNDSSVSKNSSVLSDGDKEKLKKVTEDDNPVLVFFKLKDF
jgi:hypothetical protein